MSIQDLFDIIEVSDEQVKKAFGESLKKLREHTNTTQKALSQKTGVPTQSISVYERGESAPTITQAMRIAQFFQLSIDDFIIYGIGAQTLVFDENFDSITTKYDYEHL